MCKKHALKQMQWNTCSEAGSDLPAAARSSTRQLLQRLRSQQPEVAPDSCCRPRSRPLSCDKSYSELQQKHASHSATTENTCKTSRKWGPDRAWPIPDCVSEHWDGISQLSQQSSSDIQRSTCTWNRHQGCPSQRSSNEFQWCFPWFCFQMFGESKVKQNPFESSKHFSLTKA